MCRLARRRENEPGPRYTDAVEPGALPGNVAPIDLTDLDGVPGVLVVGLPRARQPDRVPELRASRVLEDSAELADLIDGPQRAVGVVTSVQVFQAAPRATRWVSDYRVRPGVGPRVAVRQRPALHARDVRVGTAELHV